MHTLTPDQLHTDDARKLLAYINEVRLSLESRIAMQNKFAARSYLGLGEASIAEDCA